MTLGIFKTIGKQHQPAAEMVVDLYGAFKQLVLDKPPFVDEVSTPNLRL